MNIIKLQDKIMPEGCVKAPFFNNYLKGKYAYWVHMRYIVPFELMGYDAYVACEEDINKLLKDGNGNYPKPYGCEYLDLYEHIIDLYDNTALNILDYIDMDETDIANNTNEYILRNSYITDKDITLDELKKFRTWLATELLLFDSEYSTGLIKNELFSSQESHVLDYYKRGMYNEVLVALSDFGSTQININNININDCGCSSSSDVSSLYNTSLSVCEPISIYKKNIYLKMVSMFSNIDFWTRFPKEFILTFKHYIDNIININLPLSSSQYISKFADCVCGDSKIQNEGTNILKRLSNSLEYIYNGEVNGHKNYIKDSLYDWASELYEQMEW
jgi:hypothetical protein